MRAAPLRARTISVTFRATVGSWCINTMNTKSTTSIALLTAIVGALLLPVSLEAASTLIIAVGLGAVLIGDYTHPARRDVSPVLAPARRAEKFQLAA